MIITPAEVPVVAPMPIEKSSGNFGGPIQLQAPPETNDFVARVAALPTAGEPTASTKSNVPPVGIETLMELDAVTWKSRLDEAIELAQQTTRPNEAAFGCRRG